MSGAEAPVAGGLRFERYRSSRSPTAIARRCPGVWSEWAYGAEFRVDAYQENHAAGNPAFGGAWIRTAAWIGTKASNRGQARLYVDGILAKTVDMYSATTSARSIAYSHTWPQSGARTITVEVVGTAGRPAVDVDAFVRLR